MECILFSDLPRDFCIEQPDPAEIQDIKTKISRALTTLSTRQERILRLRFGLNGVGQHTLKDASQSIRTFSVGYEYAPTISEARSVEKSAIRRLQHPARNLRRLLFEDRTI